MTPDELEPEEELGDICWQCGREARVRVTPTGPVLCYPCTDRLEEPAYD